jgi:hypothetical protein
VLLCCVVMLVDLGWESLCGRVRRPLRCRFRFCGGDRQWKSHETTTGTAGRRLLSPSHRSRSRETHTGTHTGTHTHWSIKNHLTRRLFLASLAHIIFALFESPSLRLFLLFRETFSRLFFFC